MKKSKRQQKRSALVEVNKSYSLADAVKIVKQVSDNKYDETVAMNFQLGIKADSGDENVRGTVSLPHGSGKSVRVLCFCKGDSVKQAESAGADYVGGDELVQKVLGGWYEFDAVVAHPDMMREVSKLGRVLGPKGLMPTPKTGGVTPQVGQAVKELKAGRVEFKSDKTGGLHAICGKISFSEQAILENAKSVIKAVRDAKPLTSKGEYLKAITMAPTQGPGLTLNLSAL